MAPKKAAATKTAPKSAAKAAPKAASKPKASAATRGSWDKRWVGREIAITIMDDSVLVGILREVDPWALCIELTEEPGAEAIIPRDSIVLLEYSPTGYGDWFTEESDDSAAG